MRIVGTIEARMGATRLPGKTLMKVYENMPLLECVVRRFQLCKKLDEVVVATTVAKKDDPVAEWCQKNGVKYFRGSENDVLDRVVGAAQAQNADAIAQMGADSAYLDYELMDKLADLYTRGQYDYVCNDLKLTYPLGIYGHIVRVETLAALNKRTDLNEKMRSDVVRNIFEHPETYRVLNIEAEPEFNYPQLRLTIDYPEDLEQARAVYSVFKDWRFSTKDLIALYERQPAIFEKTQELVQHSAPHLNDKK